MTSAELLADLAAKGLTVRLDAGRLLVGPPDKVTLSIRQTVTEGRSGLIEMLRGEQQAAAMAAFDPWSLPGRRLSLVAISLDGRTTILPAAEWEELLAMVASNNAEADRRWERKHNGN